MIHQRIKDAQLAARKARDKVATNLLTTLIGEAESITSLSDKGALLDDTKAIALVRKFLKSNAIVINVARDNNQQDALDLALQEQALLMQFLPAQLSVDELKAAIQAVIDKGITKDGPIIGALKKDYDGRVDWNQARTIVRELVEAQG